MSTEAGHSPGTAAAQTLALQGRAGRTVDSQSAVPGWPRLLSEEQAAAYLNLSVWTFRELKNGGQVQPVRVPRVDTAKMRRRRHVNEHVRRLLFDRVTLDELVERWKRESPP